MNIEKQKSQLETLLDEHIEYRRGTLNLIASENVPSPFVEEMRAGELDRRYGYYNGIDVFDRHYQGNLHLARLEDFAHQLARELFQVQFVDLRPLSGNIAGIAAMFGLARAGETVLEVYNAHRYAAKMAGAPMTVDLHSVEIPWDGPNYNIDLDRTLRMIEQHKPRIVSIGSGLFLFPSPVREIKEAMRQHNPDSLLIYDAAHVLGLIAGGRFQDPLREGADVVISSTHKTFAGPQGGIVFTNNRQCAENLGKAVSPLLVANHHLSRISALAATFLEWLHCGPEHAGAVVANAKALGRALQDRGVPLVGAHLDFTETHMLLLIVDEFGEMQELADRLEECGIIGGTANPPAELGSNGMRLGVQELTRLGMKQEDGPAIADCIVDALKGDNLAEVKRRVYNLAQRFDTICFTI